MKTLSNIFSENISSAGQRGTNNFSKKSKHSNNVFDFLELLNCWPDIIGQKISKVTEPVKINNKKLVIYTAHSAFSQQLSMMQNQILEKIKTVYPASVSQIKALSFITNDKYFSNKGNNKISVKETEKYKKNNKLNKFSPAYQKYLEQANELFKEIEDDSVKQSLIKIFITSKDN